MSNGIFIKRAEKIEKYVEPGKVLAIYGPRQSGKTSLIRKYLEGRQEETYRFYQGDDLSVQELFSVARMERIRSGAKYPFMSSG